MLFDALHELSESTVVDFFSLFSPNFNVLNNLSDLSLATGNIASVASLLLR
jgi:hypothetical protein